MLRVHYLPCDQKFCFSLNRHCILASSFFFFECQYIGTFFVSMFYLFAISSSKYAPKGSAESSTDPFFVAWSAHNLLIALLELPPHRKTLQRSSVNGMIRYGRTSQSPPKTPSGNLQQSTISHTNIETYKI